ncbi:MAG: type II toxin-antitoxin system HicB family antitoxin [Gammaproteobacteria bacterium]
MKQKYEISIYWSDEDDAYLASVRDLPGCSGDGASYHEALTSAEKAIRLWIEAARHSGRAVPKPRRHHHGPHH